MSKKRIYVAITLSDEQEASLAKLAALQNKPRTAIAKELLLLGMRLLEGGSSADVARLIYNLEFVAAASAVMIDNVAPDRLEAALTLAAKRMEKYHAG